MTAVRIRFIITGACHVEYVGKQVRVDVPLCMANGSPTTIADTIAIVRREWPSSLGKMADTIATVPVKVLKNGHLLRNRDKLESALSSTELQECAVQTPATESGAFDEEPGRPTVLMHFVVQHNEVPSAVAVVNDSERVKYPSTGEQPGEHGSTPGEQGTEGREVKNDSCCTIM